MAASYPSSTKSFTTKTDGPSQTIVAAHVNDLQDEVVAVENALLTGVAHNIIPDADNTRALGSSSKTWSNVYTKVLTVNGAVQTALPSIAAITDGQLLIGKTSDHSLNVAALTAGSGITITNGAAAITIASPVKAYAPTLLNVTSTGETDVLSWTVGANEMADGDVLYIDLAIQLRNSSGGAITPTIKFKWGATSATLGSGAWSNVAATRTHLFHFRVQRVGNDLWLLDPSSSAQTGLESLNYDLTAASAVTAQVMTTPTFSSSQTVKLTVTLASYNATTNFWNTLAARIHKIAST
jgi:hypothetical protein